MRKGIILASLMIFAQLQGAFAHVGGPWSSNAYDGNISGTYSGIIRMNNGSGMFRFSEGPEAQISVFNVSSIFYRGIIYFGGCLATVDLNSKNVVGMTNGTSEGFETETTVTEVTTDFFFFEDSESETRTIGGFGSGSGGVVRYCNTSWEGNVTETAPIIEFKADGVAFFFGELDQRVVQTTSIRGTREFDLDAVDAIASLVEGIGGIDGLDDITIDDIIRLIDLTTTDADQTNDASVSSGGQAHVFPDIGVQERIEVFGSQLTYERFGPITPSQDGLTGTGAGGFLF